MPSPAESARRRAGFETALRGTAVAALLGALVLAWLAARRGPAASAPSVHLTVSGALTAVARDSFAALARAGRPVTWEGNVASLAAMAEPVHEPGDKWRVTVLTPGPIVLRDSLGPLDSLHAPGGVLTTASARGAVLASLGDTELRLSPPDSVSLGRVAVFARAGWEPRFVITALEEAGWAVDAHLTLGRDRDVRQGVTRLQRARHAAAIVLDTASLRREAAALARFLRDGGGVILAGEAAAGTAPALRPLLGARVIALEPPETRSFAGHEPTHALPLHALGELRDDAVLLADREGAPAIVARRVGAGRLIQLGYAETWRWRMEGEGRPVEEHRAFWSGLVGQVAAATWTPRSDLSEASARASSTLPLTELVDALGPAQPAVDGARTARVTLPAWLGLVILLALLAEWASRRARGAA